MEQCDCTRRRPPPFLCRLPSCSTPEQTRETKTDPSPGHSQGSKVGLGISALFPPPSEDTKAIVAGSRLTCAHYRAVFSFCLDGGAMVIVQNLGKVDLDEFERGMLIRVQLGLSPFFARH